MQAEATSGQRWLERMVGDWRSEGEMSGEPGEEPVRDEGTETVRPLGAWVVCEGQSETDRSAQSMMTLGFDPEKQRFVGTFISTMMATLWIYEGELDPSGNALVLRSEGPSFTREGEMGQYRDVIEFSDDDHRTFTSSQLDEDGGWRTYMTAHYRRVQ